MIVTIYQGFNGYQSNSVILQSRSEDFKKKYGRILDVPTKSLFEKMAEIADFANNELGDECLFEVE